MVFYAFFTIDTMVQYISKLLELFIMRSAQVLAGYRVYRRSPRDLPRQRPWLGRPPTRVHGRDRGRGFFIGGYLSIQAAAVDSRVKEVASWYRPPHLLFPSFSLAGSPWICTRGTGNPDPARNSKLS
jgi:hypothetical protein